MENLRYRANVAAIVQRKNGDILLGERLDTRGAWQFPQGGIKKGEPPERALERELLEEIGLAPAHYTVIATCGPFRYRFMGNLRKHGCDGQEQVYFLVRLHDGVDENAVLSHDTGEPEFRDLRWIAPGELSMDWVLETKRPVYQAVLREFFNVSLKASAS